MFRWKDSDIFRILDRFVRDRNLTDDLLALVSEEFERQIRLGARWEYIERISLDAEHPRFEIGRSARELERNQSFNQRFDRTNPPLFNMENLFLVLLHFSDTIDTAYRCDDDNIFP